MKIKNSILFLFIAFCAVQVANASSITAALKAMNTAVNNTVTQIEKDIKNFNSAEENLYSSISFTITAGAADAAQNTVSEISRAEKLGVDISSCVSQVEDSMSSIVSNTQAGLQRCMDASSASMDPDLVQINNDVKSAESITSWAQNEYNSCGVLNITCRKQVVMTAGAQGAALAAQVVKDGTSIALDLAAATTAFNACSSQVMGAGISNATAAYVQEGVCVAAFIGSESS